jgi:hypothetical protein
MNYNNLQPLPGEQRYMAWLYNRAEQNWYPLGELTPDVTGSGSLTLVDSKGNLHVNFDAIALSLEPAGFTGGAPSGEIRYSGSLSLQISNALRQILLEWTPEQPLSRQLSLLDVARAEYGFAKDHAGFALGDAQKNFAPGMQAHAGHVYNILAGIKPDISGYDVSTNPSNLKIGLMTAANAMSDLLIQAAIVENIDTGLQLQIINVQVCTNNILIWGQAALDGAQEIADAQDAAAILPQVESWNAAIVIIGEGQDADGSGRIDALENECGIESIPILAVNINVMDIYEGVDPSLKMP